MSERGAAGRHRGAERGVVDTEGAGLVGRHGPQEGNVRQPGPVAGQAAGVLSPLGEPGRCRSRAGVPDLVHGNSGVGRGAQPCLPRQAKTGGGRRDHERARCLRARPGRGRSCGPVRRPDSDLGPGPPARPGAVPDGAPGRHPRRRPSERARDRQPTHPDRDLLAGPATERPRAGAIQTPTETPATGSNLLRSTPSIIADDRAGPTSRRELNMRHPDGQRSTYNAHRYSGHTDTGSGVISRERARTRPHHDRT